MLYFKFFILSSTGDLVSNLSKCMSLVQQKRKQVLKLNKDFIYSNVNTHYTLIVVKKDGNWRIQLFQNTPAQFHGRPELVEQMTEELSAILKE